MIEIYNRRFMCVHVTLCICTHILYAFIYKEEFMKASYMYAVGSDDELLKRVEIGLKL